MFESVEYKAGRCTMKMEILD